MIPATLTGLATHIWQSTVFAAAVGLLTLVLRRNRASVRHSLWLAASCKFLIPFSLLVNMGGQFHSRAVATQIVPKVVQFTDAVSGPLLLASPTVLAPASNHASLIPFILAAVWICGFAVVLARWVYQWICLGAIVRSATPISSGLAIPVVSTSERIEPGVLGLFHPVLLLPDGITEHLTPMELHTVLTHELCHVRRRDNLTAAIHMLVEAIFWFYPFVWWLGGRMVDERERACDEEVLQAGSQAQAYAESILKVCKLYLESPLTCVSGITGSDLKERIERIMRRNCGEALSTGKKWLLATMAAAALIFPVFSGVLIVPWRLLAQATAPAWQTAAGGKMFFEVASVKPDATPGRPYTNVLLLGDAYAPTGGLFSATNIPLMNYMRFAFKDMKLAYQETPDLAAAPGWVRTKQFDIEARSSETNPTKDQMRLMVQSLLADRFKLAVHYETRQLPVYALVLAREGKSGPQLKRDDGNCSIGSDEIQAFNKNSEFQAPSPTPTSIKQIPCGMITTLPPSTLGRIRSVGRMVTLALLGEMAGPGTGVDRKVIDRTGLTGTYDIDIEFSPTGMAPPGFTVDETGPSFIQALQEQLGLKLVPQTDPVDVLVIDRVEQPSAN